jgi:hypothetical protein
MSDQFAALPEGQRYELWTEMFGGYAFRNKSYATLDDAKAGLAKIVWYNRPNFYVRQVPLPSASSGATTEEPNG